MIKFIIPAVIVFLIVLFWEKITELAEKKLNIKLNYIVVSSIIVIIAVILLLLNLTKPNVVFSFLKVKTPSVSSILKFETSRLFINPSN